MPKKTPEALNFRDIFHRIFSKYAEVKSTSGTIANGGRGGHMGHSSRGNVRVSPSDFICDFEIAVRRTFQADSGHNHYLFTELYFKGNEDLRKEMVEIYGAKNFEDRLAELETRVGKKLVERGIHPIGSYLKGVYSVPDSNFNR